MEQFFRMQDAWPRTVGISKNKASPLYVCLPLSFAFLLSPSLTHDTPTSTRQVIR